MRAFRTGLLLLSMTACGAAGAQNASSFVIDNFRYELVDLDPNDGIAPSLAFNINPAIAESLANVTSYVFWAGQTDGDFSAPSPAATPGSASLTTAFGNGTSAFSGGLNAGMRLEGSVAIGPLDGGQTSISARVQAGYLPFVLSPMTAVTFRVDSTIRALTAPPVPDAALGSASGETHMVVRSELLPEWEPLHDYRWLTAQPGQSIDQQDALQLTFTNPLARDTNNLLAIFGSAGAASHAAAVPEPAGWAMLLAGAGLVGAIARRRARRS